MPSAAPVVLTIAGSDSGGGAGIQADLRTFRDLGAFGACAIACVTAQNPRRVLAVEPVSPRLVRAQIRAVREAFPLAAVKTGMLYSAAVIRAVARSVREFGLSPLVVDPVMVATSGARLLRRDAVQSLCRDLLPLATVATPNVPEAEVLAGMRVVSVEDMKRAAAAIARRYGIACVVKGGHLGESRIADCGLRIGEKRGGATKAQRHKAGTGKAMVADALWAGGRIHVFESPRVKRARTHGTGCVFSAALAAFLARGFSLPESVRRAKRHVRENL